MSRGIAVPTHSNTERGISMNIYSGYVYIWYDTKAKLFYVGGHYGHVNDSYLCSSKTMLRAYKKRPDTFKFKVLEYVCGTTIDLRICEQKWLNKIKDSELMISENVKNKTCRYYNVKKNAIGGNGLGTNKNKSSIGGWNRGLKGVQDYNNPEHRLKRSISAKQRWKKIKNGEIPAPRKRRPKCLGPLDDKVEPIPQKF